MILPANDTTSSNANAVPPAYSAAGAPAPRYTPKKDFGKAFAELQGRYGFDGGVTVLASKEKKPKTRHAYDSSSNKSFVKAIKSFVTKSPNVSPERPRTSDVSSSTDALKNAKAGKLQDDQKESGHAGHGGSFGA